jgi:hypothetical protein
VRIAARQVGLAPTAWKSLSALIDGPFPQQSIGAWAAISGEILRACQLPDNEHLFTHS